MGKSNAERQREFRLRRDQNAQKRQEYLQKKREKYKADLESGKRKTITDMNDREKRGERKKWRKSKQESRQRKKNKEVLLTPPGSPSEPEPSTSRQRTQSQRKRNRKNAKCYREIEQLRKQLALKEKQVNKYKMRVHRLKSKMEAKDSPRTKTNRLMGLLHQKESAVRKQLTFHFALLQEIKEKYSMTKYEREKQNIKRIVSGKIIKKYKFKGWIRREIGFNGRKVKLQGRRAARKLSESTRQAIRQFFERDDVSRMTTGKKMSVTRQKLKKQKRLLLDTMKVLHLKYNSEHPSVSYASFCRLRPFWVLPPTERDRDTCLCKSHENLQYMVNKLHSLQVIATTSLEMIVDSIVCDVENKECAYGTCNECKTNAYPIQEMDDPQAEVTFPQWTQEKVQFGETSSTITVKSAIETTLDDLNDQFQKSLGKFKKHLYNIRHQYQVYSTIKNNLGENQCLIHVDFSENYQCKYSTEIQAVHFGGSHQQSSLHTGVLYTKEFTKPFCSISPSRRHDPAAIWAHLKPILTELREQQPSITTIHMFSDGPVTQYRNFYLLSTEPFRQGFQQLAWHYFEASHGKGAPDGIGGSLKRTADRLVRHGKDIPNPQSLFDELKKQDSNISLYYIDPASIEEYDQKLSAATLTNVKGTIQIHQVLSLSQSSLQVRDVSCVCSLTTEQRLDCSCFGLTQATVCLNQPDANESQGHTESITESTSTPLQPESMSESTPPQSQSPSEPSSSETQPESIRESAATSQRDGINRPIEITDEHNGQWCVVNYDAKLYPGKIISIENGDVSVTCMHRVGENRFYWPLIDDVCWYEDKNIVSFIPEPSRASSRHVKVQQSIWDAIQNEYE